jgi:RNA ligase
MSDDLVFPVLTNDVALRQAVAHKPEIRFMDQENGTVICSYIVSCDGTFDEMYSREARGVVFKDGKVISRPLHKFFNLNQNPEVLFENVDWSKVVRVMNKRDGSMIHTAAVKNSDKFWPDHFNFDLKSKKSYTSDVAHQAKAFMMLADSAGVKGYGELCNWCVENDVTAIFEWTSPIARIVVGYAKDELRLLHIRDNVTGEYFTRDEVHKVADTFNVPGVDDASMDSVGSAAFDDLITAIKTNTVQNLIDTVEGIEGWVIQFENGDMLKIKTKWYMDRHRAMTFLRERDIAEMALNETLDDLKSVLVGEGCDITEINAIEARVVAEIDAIIWSVNDIFELVGNKTKKDLAIFYGPQGCNHPFFKLIMNKKDDKEPDYKSFYERNYLRDQFTLRQLNLLQTTAELDE